MNPPCSTPGNNSLRTDADTSGKGKDNLTGGSGDDLLVGDAESFGGTLPETTTQSSAPTV